MKNKSLILGWLFFASLAQADMPLNILNKTQEQLKEQKLTKVAKELQDVLATKMLEQIFEGQKTNKLFGGGSAEKTYQSLLNEERAKSLDLGLVEQIKQQMQVKVKGKERKDAGVKR